MTRMAAVDQRKGKYAVCSSSYTTTGVWIGNGTFEILDTASSDQELGAAVYRMLEASRTGVPHPDLRNGPSPAQPILDALGIRSYSTYQKGTRHVDIMAEDDGKMAVAPYSNDGRDGFNGIPEKERHTRNPPAEELGALVRAALDDAT